MIEAGSAFGRQAGSGRWILQKIPNCGRGVAVHQRFKVHKRQAAPRRPKNRQPSEPIPRMQERMSERQQVLDNRPFA